MSSDAGMIQVGSLQVVRSLARAQTPAAIALGNFDGVHQGHQQVLKPILGREGGAGKTSGGISTVVTFDPHPRQVLGTAGTAVTQLLTPLPEKLALFERLGVAQVVLLPFTSEFAQQSPQAFIDQVLQRGLSACRLSVGTDFCFGHQRLGTAQTLAAWGAQVEIPVHVVPEWRWDGERVSSSRIRQALGAGEMALATHLLGRPYRLAGEVVAGDRRGRTLGFPTANVQVNPQKVLPRDGVYVVQISTVDHQTSEPTSLATEPQLLNHLGVVNIGCRPTVDGTTRTVEAHLLNWQGDLYGQTLTLDLVHFLRPEQKFASLEALQAQLALDCQQAKQWGRSPTEPVSPKPS